MTNHYDFIIARPRLYFHVLLYKNLTAAQSAGIFSSYMFRPGKNKDNCKLADSFVNNTVDTSIAVYSFNSTFINRPCYKEIIGSLNQNNQKR